MATDKQINANRKNAKKSTGPKTEAGKKRSRQNALKHGLCSQGEVMCEEDVAMLEAAMVQWNDFYRPVGPGDAALVRRGATADIKLRRCEKTDTSNTYERVRNAQCDFDLERHHRLQSLVERLPIEPDHVVPMMKMMPEGCA